MLTLFLAYLDNDNDKKLFENIYLSYRKQLFVLANSILHNESDAEDVVSEVFLRIAQKNWDTVRKIDHQTDIRNYLLKATKNTALNKIKTKSKTNISFDTVNEYDIGSIKDLSDDSFLETICNKVEYSKILEAIRSLNEKYRDVMYCHYVVEMTIPQTAKYLNQTTSATKQRLVRGKKILLSLLGIKGAE